MLEKVWDKYLEEYEEEYNKHIEEREKEIPMLMAVFEQFEEKIYEPTKIYKLMVKVKDEIEEELRESLTNEQKEILDRVNVCDDNMLNDFVEKAFIYGFTVANKLIEESRMMNKKKH